MNNINKRLDEILRNQGNIIPDSYDMFETKQAIKQLMADEFKKLIGEDEQFVITEKDVNELCGHNYFFKNKLDPDYSAFLDDKTKDFSVGYDNDIPLFSYHNADRLIKNKLRQKLEEWKQ